MTDPNWMIPAEVDRSLEASVGRLTALSEAYNRGWALCDGVYQAYADVLGSTHTLRFDIEAVCKVAGANHQPGDAA